MPNPNHTCSGCDKPGQTQHPFHITFGDNKVGYHSKAIALYVLNHLILNDGHTDAKLHNSFPFGRTQP